MGVVGSAKCWSRDVEAQSVKAGVLKKSSFAAVGKVNILPIVRPIRFQIQSFRGDSSEAPPLRQHVEPQLFGRGGIRILASHANDGNSIVHGSAHRCERGLLGLGWALDHRRIGLERERDATAQTYKGQREEHSEHYMRDY